MIIKKVKSSQECLLQMQMRALIWWKGKMKTKQKSSKTWAQAVQSKGKKIKTTAKFWTTIGQSPETKVPYKADS